MESLDSECCPPYRPPVRAASSGVKRRTTGSTCLVDPDREQDRNQSNQAAIGKLFSACCQVSRAVDRGIPYPLEFIGGDASWLYFDAASLTRPLDRMRQSVSSTRDGIVGVGSSQSHGWRRQVPL